MFASYLSVDVELEINATLSFKKTRLHESISKLFRMEKIRISMSLSKSFLVQSVEIDKFNCYMQKVGLNLLIMLHVEKSLKVQVPKIRFVMFYSTC